MSQYLGNPMQRWAEQNIGDTRDLLIAAMNQPIYYGDQRPMPKKETIAVPVDLVWQLKKCRLLPVGVFVDGLLARLPEPPETDVRDHPEVPPTLHDPPKPDPVEECAKAFVSALPETGPIGPIMRAATRAALRHYCAMGFPEIPE